MLTTEALSYNATAAQVAAALNALTGLNVSVTGSGVASAPWQITGTGFSDLTPNDGSLTGGSSVIDLVMALELWNAAQTGTFTISVTPAAGGTTQTTTALDYNATAAQVQAALNTLTGVKVTVTGTGVSTTPWLIVGTGLAGIAIDNSELASGPATAWSATTAVGVLNLWNFANAGSFTLSIDLFGGQTATSSALAYNATAAQVQAALNALAGVTVVVTGSGTQSDPWVIVGTGLTGLSTNDSLWLAFVPPLPTSSQLEFASVSATEIWTNASRGVFTISLPAGSGQTQTTPEISASASAQQIFSALSALDGVDIVAVTGTGSPANPWTILGNGLTGLTLDSSALSLGVTSWFNETATGVLDLWNNAAGGTFTITLTPPGGTTQTTAPLAWNASAAEVATAFNALTGVSVSVTGSGTSGTPWELFGTGLSGLSTDDTNLTPAAGATTASSQNANDSVPSQELWNTAGAGTFTLSVVSSAGQTSTSAALAWNATPDAIAAALNMLPGVNVWAVVGTGVVSDPWTILGSGLDTLAANSSQLQAGASSWVTLSQATQSLATNATSGSFTLDLEVGGQALTTPAIPWNATAAQVAAAINSLSGVVGWVTGEGTATNPWLLQVNLVPLQTGSPLTFQDAWGQANYGLLNGTTYYAVLQPLVGTPGTVVLGLASTSANALAAPPGLVPLQGILPLGNASQSLLSGTAQTITPVMQASGIQISASLKSEEDSSGEADFGSTLPKESLATNGNLAAGLLANKIIDKLKLPTGKVQSPSAEQVAAGNMGNMYTASANITRIHNTVQAIVGPTAVLSTKGTVQISSQVTDKLKAKDLSGVTVGKKSQLGIALALQSVVVHNTSEAYIASGAKVLGGEGVSVNSRVTYPEPSESDYFDMLKFEMPTNLWGGAGANPRTLPDVSLRNSFSTSLCFVDYTTRSWAQIAAGAQIFTSDPNQTGGMVTPRPISVTATTVFNQIGLNALMVKHQTGLYNQWPFNKVKKLQKLASKGNNFLAFPSGTNAIGGSFSDITVDTETVALVGGVDPANDPVTQPTTIEFGNGGLNVAADTNLLYVQLMEAGGTATNFGIMGTVGFLNIPNQVTRAAIEPVQPSVATTGPVMVVQANAGTTGDVTVSANDDTQLILIAGDYLSASNIGVGASAAVANVNRTVTAQVGTAAGATPLVSSFSGMGDMDVSALADGFVLPIALAGIGPAGGGARHMATPMGSPRTTPQPPGPPVCRAPARSASDFRGTRRSRR